MGNLAEMIYSCEMLQFHADALSRGMNWASISLDFFSCKFAYSPPNCRQINTRCAFYSVGLFSTSPSIGSNKFESKRWIWSVEDTGLYVNNQVIDFLPVYLKTNDKLNTKEVIESVHIGGCM